MNTFNTVYCLFTNKAAIFLSHFTTINFSLIKIVLVINFLICANQILTINSSHKNKY